MKKFLIVLIALLLVIPTGVNASETVIDIYLFYSNTCPHCAKEKEYLSDLQENDPNINVYMYEVSENQENSDLLDKVQTLIDGETPYIPYTVIGSKYRVGFNNSTKLEIENIIKSYREGDYVNIVGGIIDGSITEDNINTYLEESEVEVDDTVDIPLLGKVDPKSVSLPILSIVMGLVDGFNPCAMWVLIFLISMLLNMKDKKRMWFLGVSFLLTSSMVYLLFMLAWLNIVMSISEIRWVQILIALVAVIGGLINLRSYYRERKKDAGCVVVNDEKRKKIFDRIKKFTHEKSIILATIGVIALAVSVNIVELACSAGLPVLFTNILAINNLDQTVSIIYILIYVFFFMLDDLIVFAIAMFTLQVTGVTTKYTKYTHLIGGIIMLLIGLLLIIKPEWIMFNF